MAETVAGSRRPDRFLLGIVVGSVLLIILGIAAVYLAGRTPPTPAADPNSPVGVVQAYIEALRAGDAERAYSYLGSTAQASVPRDRYLERFPRFAPPTEASRLLIEPVSVGPDTAEVKVTISRFNSGGAPFSTNTYHQDVAVRLVKEDGEWRIVQPAEPFMFSY
jgi:hypothetical protein